MSVSEVSNNTSTPVEDKSAQNLEKYNKYYKQYTDLVDNEDYKSYFGANGELKELKDTLKEKLDALNEAITNTYDEKVIDELMESLGALLASFKVSLANAGVQTVLSANKTKVISQNGSLSLLVARSDNVYKELESELKSTEKLDNESKVDEKLRRLRDEGIWADSSLNRREQMLQEEEARESRKKND